jgi:aminoglycoside phosphotransferase (APT) family kinase protein
MPVADDELHDALQYVLGRQVRAIARRSNVYRSSFAIEDLEVFFEDGPPLALVFKDLAVTALTPETAKAKPVALLDPAREIEAYLEVLRPTGMEVPDCYGAVIEPCIDRYWLFLEVIDGVPLWQVGDLDAWDRAARWLAGLHGHGAPDRQGRLIRYDAAYFRGWLERAVALTPEGSLNGIAARWDQVVERLSAWPRTLVHGEFYPSNVLIRHGPASVVPVDWEMAGVGPGVLDVAALVSGGWSPAERERLALVYRDSLPRRGRPAADDLLDALTHCRLYVAVQWLGWSENWSPPVEHAHDWLAEALALAEELGF